MPSSASLDKLHPHLHQLIAKVNAHAGHTETDQVKEWIDKIAVEVVERDSLKDLDSQLIPKTYVVSNYLTSADVALYGALHPLLSALKPSEYYSHPAIVRYFDHIQSLPAVRIAADSLSPSFSFIQFDLDNAPKIVRKEDPPKKKTPKSAAKGSASSAETGDPPSVKDVPSPAAPQEAKTQKKEKEKKTKKGGPVTDSAQKKAVAESGKKSGTEDAEKPSPSMIDLRVGHIVDVKRHPDADGLYVEQIDLGEESGPRTVVSGLVKYIPIEEMRDKYLVAICNLKPATLRGVKSFAMVLCASAKEGKEGGIELIQPPPDSKPGDKVYFEGAEYENAVPLPQLNPKKQIFETIQPGFTTLDTREAAWVNPETKGVHRIRTEKGYCVAPSLVGASLS